MSFDFETGPVGLGRDENGYPVFFNRSTGEVLLQILTTGINFKVAPIGTDDADITTLQSQMTTAEGDIDSLEDRMTTAEGDISTLEGEMAAVESDVSTLEGEMDDAEGRISTLEGFHTTSTTTAGA